MINAKGKWKEHINFFNTFHNELIKSDIAERVVDFKEGPQNILIFILDDGSEYWWDYLRQCHTFPPKLSKLKLDPYTADPEVWNIKFAKKLNKKIIASGATQAVLASITGISTMSISRYCKGKAIPSAHNLSKICKALHCTPNDLLDI